MVIMELQLQTYVSHVMISVADVLDQQVIIASHVHILMALIITYHLHHLLVYKYALMDNIPVVLIFVKYAIPTVILVVIMPLIVLVVICKQVHMYSFIITFVYENAQLTIMDKHLTTLA